MPINSVQAYFADWEIPAAYQAVARHLDARTIYVNGHGFIDPAFPFGGLGQSGFGKELGPEQVKAYLKTKSVPFSGLSLPGEASI
jgi:acyl-CoA reductase-like NAD-dependent aldehyde dehydrogenase